MTNETIQVQGMSCGHCVSSVEGAVGGLDGVDKVNVHLQEGKVDVSFDEGKVKLDEITEAIEDQGYDVV
ncbi:copper chaperone CopZ [Oceanobacillus neutriphilus]|uniref:Copper chaperone CopZ n=1 Tax=Oceanobacillus neutriphilus TaxID=531815 RepID=A0ABQ2NW89_9BACI|nr:copper chaperone CopZ [Oceanobacillus neutriphilus]GGP12126.1 copper chaperone CopZ [Oceanobacillus neutriphilus]